MSIPEAVNESVPEFGHARDRVVRVALLPDHGAHGHVLTLWRQAERIDRLFGVRFRVWVEGEEPGIEAAQRA